jgi:hypothetical protein
MLGLVLASRRPALDLIDAADDTFSLLQTSVMVEANADVLLPLSSSNSSEDGSIFSHGRKQADGSIDEVHESASLLQQWSTFGVTFAKLKQRSATTINSDTVMIVAICLLMPVVGAGFALIWLQRMTHSKNSSNDFRAAAEHSIIPGSLLSNSFSTQGSGGSPDGQSGTWTSNDKLSSNRYQRGGSSLSAQRSHEPLPPGTKLIGGQENESDNLVLHGEVKASPQAKVQVSFMEGEKSDAPFAVVRFNEEQDSHGILIHFTNDNTKVFLDTGPLHDEGKKVVEVLPIGENKLLDPMADPLATIMLAANHQGYIAEAKGQTVLLARASKEIIHQIVDNDGATVATLERGHTRSICLSLRKNLQHALQNLIVVFVITALKLGAQVK